MSLVGQGIAGHWHDQPRRWGHPFHSICSYFAMFPPRLPRVLISWLSAPGEAVWDPFCGRGTVPFEACQLGRRGLGSDMNPLAVALTSAKVDPPTRAAVVRRLAELRAAYKPGLIDSDDAPPEIRMLFHYRTLGQLLWLRRNLSQRSRTDRFIVALILGLLHANANRDGSPRGLSVPMPNTFAMSPGYVRRFIRDHHLRRPDVDVYEKLRARAMTLPWPILPIHGRGWRQDALESSPTKLRGPRPSLILTSPPYLDVISYAKYNWVRMWFLGSDWRQVERTLFSTSSPDRYQVFMDRLLEALKDVLTPDGYLALVVGDVTKSGGSTRLGDRLTAAAHERGWTALASIKDAIPDGNRVSRIWADDRVRGVRTDRIVILSRGRRTLPQLQSVSWEVASC
jgi:hypothetical protein